MAALAARRRDTPFGAADVAPDIISPELHVIATAQEAALDSATIASVRSVVVKARGNKDLSQATRPVRTAGTTEYKSVYGLEYKRPGVIAVFPLDVVVPGNEIHVGCDRIAKGSSALTTCQECVVPFPISKIR